MSRFVGNRMQCRDASNALCSYGSPVLLFAQAIYNKLKFIVN